MIETHISTSQEKLTWWGKGPWITEPDVVDFVHCGFNCKVHRKFRGEESPMVYGGHLCGYIEIPEGHPWSNLERDTEVIDADVHGGITYNGESLFDGHWVGFDCAHGGDLMPCNNEGSYYEQLMKKMNIKFPRSKIFTPTYKTVRFCIEECKSLAEAAFKATSSEPPRAD